MLEHRLPKFGHFVFSKTLKIYSRGVKHFMVDLFAKPDKKENEKNYLFSYQKCFYRNLKWFVQEKMIKNLRDNVQSTTSLSFWLM